MKTNSKLGKVALVTWEDAWSNSKAYHTFESILKEPPLICKVVGFLIRDDKHGVTVALEDVNHEEYRTVQHIPRAMVRNVKILS